MKTLGLIGGTSWHSTIEYYRYINQYVNDHFGDNTNPPLMVYTLNQANIHRYQRANNWEAIADMLIDAGQRLQRAGAERLMFCANTPHKVYEQVSQALYLPIMHIADATAHAIEDQGIDSVCFLGTKYTMTEDFVTNRIASHRIAVLCPEEKAVIEELHRIIQEELTFGKILPQPKQYVIDVIASLAEKGAKGVVLGCTEFPLMIHAEDLKIPIFNTTEIHALAGAKFILKDN
ncbi:MAG: aspartate/glutamate racemase family protein [Bacteroidia bacterium]